jgi:c-di-AMP phosphodiesterase-like protein
MLSQVNKVIVLGHSMSDVDICYFEKIIQSIQQLENVCCYVSYYTDEEYETICQQLRKIGIDRTKASLITPDESNQCSGISFNNQLSIF